jgi:hypothetical protein
MIAFKRKCFPKDSLNKIISVIKIKKKSRIGFNDNKNKFMLFKASFIFFCSFETDVVYLYVIF